MIVTITAGLYTNYKITLLKYLFIRLPEDTTHGWHNHSVYDSPHSVYKVFPCWDENPICFWLWKSHTFPSKIIPSTLLKKKMHNEKKCKLTFKETLFNS